MADRASRAVRFCKGRDSFGVWGFGALALGACRRLNFWRRPSRAVRSARTCLPFRAARLPRFSLPDEQSTARRAYDRARGRHLTHRRKPAPAPRVRRRARGQRSRRSRRPGGGLLVPNKAIYLSS
ncbi:unnamed protein product [Amoebophrya sp. A120]|nr:unnamed protein product [Amoebophrya sp. A120]|eukprot:GSA120T00016874001.1